MNEILPTELLQLVFLNLGSLNELLCVSQTCRLWRKLIFNQWFLNRYHSFEKRRKDLIGWWKFESSFLDSSGVIGKNYTLHGIPTFEDCFLGKCVKFNGQESIDINISNKKQYQTDVFSVSIWFLIDASALQNWTDLGAGWRTAIGSWEHPRNCWLHLGFSRTGRYIQNQAMISDDEYQFNCDSDVKIQADKWYHVVANVSRNCQKIWVNGQLSGTKDMTDKNNKDDIRNSLAQDVQWDEQKLQLAASLLHIGCKDGMHMNPWRGKIAEVSIWNRWLSRFEIEALYEQKVNVDKIAIGTQIFREKPLISTFF
ncbi:unnamed protein product [Didymodactylos carnosus]|uniref:F-box domain-containing protein n=1 Tax=Didymodactylos carnosus TaxID=1234261 RepID=A0A816A3D7_9BILA|nr:unnamed protein product [Didymodactylos carnosus]CAF1591015.1 unnamed protein product [Didymodactylos carnosus]CAF4238894.1 unnamed protein product [Didymodactylos carnosus]CAF4463200.1 unnamed protein product [Didymodactylos carnosus]